MRFGLLEGLLCIKYNVNGFSLSGSDIKCHLKRNGNFYIGFLLSFVIGIIISIVIIFTNESFINILTASDKVLYYLINGQAKVGTLFWRNLIDFLLPMLLIFLLNLNFYSGLVSFILIGYQSALLVMCLAALVYVYGISGAINSILLLVPINLLYIGALIVFSVFCLERSYLSKRYKYFAYDLNSKLFWLKVVVITAVVFAINIAATVIFPLFLKNAIFVIF